MESEINKTCSTCKGTFSNDRFIKRRLAKDGLSGQCKDCINATRRKYVNSNAERMLEKRIEYENENKDRIRKRAADYYLKNCDKLRKYSREWAKQNPEKVRAQRERSKIRNKESGKHKLRWASMSESE